MSGTTADAAAAQAAVDAAVDGVLTPIFKLLVGWLCFASIIDTGNDCAWAYRYTIQSYLKPQNLAEWPTTFTIFGFWTGINVYLCQLFFIWRGWVVAGRDRYIFAVLQLVIATGATVCIFLVSGKSISWDLMAEFMPSKPIIYAWLAGGLAVGAGYLVYNLIIRPRKGGGGNLTPSSPLKRLAILAMKTNAASLVVQLTVLILIVSKPTLHYAIIGFNETKTYAVCVIATLNARSVSQSGTSYGATSGEQGRIKGLGASNTFGNGHASVHVHRSVHVDEESQYQRRDEAPTPYALFVLEDGTTVAKGATSEKELSGSF
ncbi:hypothetical protein JCM6882_004328 [Rhodosporidiobolus microsporus]